jgi:S-adenosylmethionine:tRNA ribosyltransferase-isomerase
VLVSEFDFALPEELIARHPAEERDGSRLLVISRASGATAHRKFVELPSLLAEHDLLVFNDTKVLPARLRAKKAETGGRVEVLLVEELAREDEDQDDAGGPHIWRAMVNASKGVREGARLVLERDASVTITVLREEGNGFVVLGFDRDARLLAHALGELPLPPYLGRPAEDADLERYQTVFARADAEASVAAPTAGLHFTPRVLDALAARGISRAPITLHVGPGTFLPVRVEDISKHEMLPERFQIPGSTREAMARARAAGGRVVAVGTTVTRVLESDARGISGATNLFIHPGHEFRAVDAILTNFHLPKSTLIMLVAAFAGREPVLAAYREAVRERYRFFSYGDATLIL